MNHRSSSSEHIVWKEQYSVNAKVLDAEHQMLFGILNDLHKTNTEGVSRERLLEVFQELIEYSQTHFRNEEFLLEQKGYPNLEQQRDEHALYLEYLINLQAECKRDVKRTGDEILKFVTIWWEDHIQTHDQGYAYLFKSI